MSVNPKVPDSPSLVRLRAVCEAVMSGGPLPLGEEDRVLTREQERGREVFPLTTLDLAARA